MIDSNTHLRNRPIRLIVWPHWAGSDQSTPTHDNGGSVARFARSRKCHYVRRHQGLSFRDGTIEVPLNDSTNTFFRQLAGRENSISIMTLRILRWKQGRSLLLFPAAYELGVMVTSWPARASWYANVLPILPAPITAIDKGDLAAGAIFFMTTSPLTRTTQP